MKGKKTNYKGQYAEPKIVPYAPPRFAVDDPAGYEYLEEHGYVVFKDVVTPPQLEEGRKLAWDFLEGLPNASIKRNDPETWNYNWPDPYRKGIIVSEGVGHSSFLWFTRALPTVQTIFSSIWQTPDLATSFDGFCMFRPAEYNPNWATLTGWFHLDQNGLTKPDKVCVQGFCNYYDSGETDGGLVVVPGSHKVFLALSQNYPSLFNGRSDFVRLDKFGPTTPWQNEIKQARLCPIKVCAQAGDMILWDSRVIHCNAPPTTLRPLPKDGSILPPRRLVAYVCMTPLSRLTPDIVGKRQEAFRLGHTSTHWPEDIRVSGRTNASSWRFKPPKLPQAARKLIPLWDDEEESSESDMVGIEESTTQEQEENPEDPEAEVQVRAPTTKPASSSSSPSSSSSSSSSSSPKKNARPARNKRVQPTAKRGGGK